jgi:hypothetical protein
MCKYAAETGWLEMIFQQRILMQVRCTLWTGQFRWQLGVADASLRRQSASVLHRSLTSRRYSQCLLNLKLWA